MATNSYLNYCASSSSLGSTISPHFFVASTKLNPYQREIIFGEATNPLFAQHAKKVVSDSPGLVDFAIGLVKSVFNLPDGQVMFFEGFEKQKKCEINSARRKAFGSS